MCPFRAFAESTFPSSSSVTCTVTLPEAFAARAVAGYAGFGRLTARLFSIPTLTFGTVGDGVTRCDGVGVGLSVGRVFAALALTLTLALASGVGVLVGVGVGVLVGVGVFRFALVLTFVL